MTVRQLEMSVAYIVPLIKVLIIQHLICDHENNKFLGHHIFDI